MWNYCVCKFCKQTIFGQSNSFFVYPSNKCDPSNSPRPPIAVCLMSLTVLNINKTSSISIQEEMTLPTSSAKTLCLVPTLILLKFYSVVTLYYPKLYWAGEPSWVAPYTLYPAPLPYHPHFYTLLPLSSLLRAVSPTLSLTLLTPFHVFRSPAPDCNEC